VRVHIPLKAFDSLAGLPLLFILRKTASFCLLSFMCLLSHAAAPLQAWEFGGNSVYKASDADDACAQATAGFGPVHSISGFTSSPPRYNCYSAYGYMGYVELASFCSDNSPPVTWDGTHILPLNEQCSDIRKKMGPPLCELRSPNPIHAGTGNKYWSDTDFAGANGLEFRRDYNSQNTGVLSTLGAGWQHSYARFITPVNSTTDMVMMARPNGAAYAFTANGNSYVSQDADITDKLSRLTDSAGTFTGWKYQVAADDSVETYNVDGKLLTITSRAALTQTLLYSDGTTPKNIAPKAGLLIRVTDAFSRQLNFTYDSSSRVVSMTNAAGEVTLYSYDDSNNLVSIGYPDNKTKTYRYNEASYTNGASLPNALTGIVDENGIRYASYTYNAQGKAYLENHAGGVDQYQLTYNANSTVITDPLGTARTYNYQTILGVDKPTGQSQPGGAGCGAASNAVTYDANGNVASRTDFNGVKTTYQYDLTRNIETSRTEAFGTPQARTITTQWHATYRLPLKIAEPRRRTTLTYDVSGNLLTKTLQATTDTTGASGFTATVTGTARTWTYTYNTVGQVLTATGPRTDVVDRTTYTYDAQGNLVSITNAAGHLTTLSNYDANGRTGRITDPNGITTDLSYSARGWLTSKTVSGTGGAAETTSYDYDGVGQMTRATLPDGSAIFYTYDPAHRLTNIADSLGNSMTYTLDAMGNRTNEQVKDPNGTLARQTSRIYDALNRLQQVTGAAQ
jgi:YD repeat-containing protein